MSRYHRPEDRRERLTAVTKTAPCQVCGSDHKCSRGDGGLIVCGRRDGPVPGFRHLGPSKGDPQFHLYRRDDGADPPAPALARKPKPNPPRDWGAAAIRYAKDLTADARAELAERLGLPIGVFDSLPLFGTSGRTMTGWVFTFPECDGDGRVIGITERTPRADGTAAKKMQKGGSRGLTIPVGWQDRPGPVLLVEGASDTLALTAAGLAVVGRPSNTGGAEHLARLLVGWPADRGVVVVGENDGKPDWSWPGRDGANRTAAALAARLHRPVEVVMPRRTGRRTCGRGSSGRPRPAGSGRPSARNCSPPSPGRRDRRPGPGGRRSWSRPRNTRSTTPRSPHSRRRGACTSAAASSSTSWNSTRRRPARRRSASRSGRSSCGNSPRPCSGTNSPGWPTGCRWCRPGTAGARQSRPTRRGWGRRFTGRSR